MAPFSIAAAAPLHRLQVPQRWERNKPLGQWLSRQKLMWRNGELSASRIAQLRALGVEVLVPPGHGAASERRAQGIMTHNSASMHS